MGSEERPGAESARAAAEAAFRQYLAREAEGARDPEAVFRRLPPEARGLAEQMLADLARLRSRYVEQGPEPGLRLGSYALVRRVGTGGASSVWAATDLRLEREVAVKILHPALALSEAQIDRFQRESRLSSTIPHPGICQVYDVGFDRGFHFIVQELVPEGRTLASRIDELRRTEARDVEWQPVAKLFLRICDAVAAVHRAGVTHRDLKPNNFLLRPDGQPLVADFGLAAVLEEGPLGRTSLRLGTPNYLAPEQVAGEQLHGFSGDVFSLGVSLYEALLLRRPFDGETATIVGRKILEEEPVPPRRLEPSIPRDLETIVLHALEKDPERRYPDAGAMAEDLRRLLEHRPILAARAGLVRRLAQLARRSPARAAALSLAVLLLLFAAGFLVETSRLNAELRRRSESFESLVAGFRGIAAYLAPGSTSARASGDLDFLPELERVSREVYANEPAELARTLEVVATYWGELGDVEREVGLLHEAIGLMEASSSPAEPCLELRIRLFEVLYRELRTDEAFPVAREGLEQLGRNGDVPSRARLQLRAEAAEGLLDNEDLFDDLAATDGIVQLPTPLDLDERFGEAAIDERTRLDLEYWQLVKRTNVGDFPGAAEEATSILGRFQDEYGAGHPFSLDAGISTLRIWKQSGSNLTTDRDKWIPAASQLSRELLDAVSGGFRAKTSLGIRIRRVRAEIALHEARPSEAVALYDEVLRDLGELLEPNSPRLLEVRVGRASALLTLDPARSVRELDEVLLARESTALPLEQLNLTTHKALCMALVSAGKFERGLKEVAACCESYAERGGALGVEGVLEIITFLITGPASCESIAESPGDAEALRARNALVRKWLDWSLDYGARNDIDVPALGIALWLAEEAHAAGDRPQRDEWLSLASDVQRLYPSSGARQAYRRYILRTSDPGGQARTALAQLEPDSPLEERLRRLRASNVPPHVITQAVLSAAADALLTDGEDMASWTLETYESQVGVAFEAEFCLSWAGELSCRDCPFALTAHLLRRIPDQEVPPKSRRVLERVCASHAGPCAAPPESVQRIELE